MARYTGPKDRLSRREGVVVSGAATMRRAYPPGQHGPKGYPRKQSGYGQQLREKQKAKRLYGILERQFRTYVEQALRRRGDSAAMLQQLLERRLDNVVYRLGWAPSRYAARQLVQHGNVAVATRTVDIPSYLVAVGQTLQLHAGVGKRSTWQATAEALGQRSLPSWLQPREVSGAPAAAAVTAFPGPEEAERAFDAQAIIEFYSK